MEELFNKILGSMKKNNTCAVATVVSSRGSAPRKIGAKMVVFGDGSIEGSIGGGGLEKLVMADAREALKRGRSFLKSYSLDRRSGLQVCGGKVSIFIETVVPDKRLVIAGAGHIGLALSLIAKLLGFNVVIVDNRRDFARKERFPHADRVIRGPYQEAIKKIRPDKNTSIVIVTHGHAYDADSLEAALKTPAGYIGMIGSAAKIDFVFKTLLKKGFKQAELRKVHSPVGLKIGAQTPAEIAVAIAAQLIQAQKRRAACL